ISSRTCKPNSVCRSDPAGRSFLWATHYCEALATYPEVGRAEPARVPAEAGTPSLFGLAPCGVCPARRITAAAVRPYRTFSPLPRPCGRGGMFSVALSVESSPSLQKMQGRGALPDVIRHTALRSSDFPLPPPEGAEATVRSGCQLIYYIRCRWGS